MTRKKNLSAQADGIYVKVEVKGTIAIKTKGGTWNYWQENEPYNHNN